MKKELPISIIIPAKNEEKYLPLLLESIRAQNRQPMEVIVADGNSSDKTRQIARKLGNKVLIGGTIPVGRNKGAKKARGKFLYFIDADCQFPTPDFLEKSLVLFKKQKLHGGCFYFKSAPDAVHFYQRLAFWIMNRVKWWNNLVRIHNIDFGAAMIYRKDIFEKLHGFDENLTHYEDTNLAQRLYRLGGKYRCLPLYIINSARRFKNPSQTLRVIFAGIIASFTMSSSRIASVISQKDLTYRRDRGLKLAGKVYGELGGESSTGK